MKLPSTDKGIYLCSPMDRLLHRLELLICATITGISYALGHEIWGTVGLMFTIGVALIMLIDARDRRFKDRKE